VLCAVGTHQLAAIVLRLVMMLLVVLWGWGGGYTSAAEQNTAGLGDEKGAI
jgi:hypothetical protein